MWRPLAGGWPDAGELGDELQKREKFNTLLETRVIIEAWRPH
jgi:hypothetical protein